MKCKSQETQKDFGTNQKKWMEILNKSQIEKKIKERGNPLCACC